jgi:hypothetical protein
MGVNKLIKKRIVRGITNKIMGLGRVPMQIPSLEASTKDCSKILVRWTLAMHEDHFPVHRVVAERYSASVVAGIEDMIDMDGQATIPLPTWMTVFAGFDDMFLDTGLPSGSTVDYRLSLWNEIGRSEYFYVTGLTLGGEGCNAQDDSEDERSSVAWVTLVLGLVGYIVYSYSFVDVPNDAPFIC